MAKLSHLAHRLYAHVQQAKLLPRSASVVVACSGGPDSLALLALLLELRPLLHLTVTAAHYEHGIRGAASIADAAFVQQFCAERGVPCLLAHGDARAAAAAGGESLETAARRLRYAFLERARLRAGADWILTAHHADDQAETVLLHLLRGTGIDGLAGIRARDEARHLVRPLLPFPKRELAAYCRAQGFSPRRDATNEVPDALRNRVRLELLPALLRGYNPSLRQGLCRLARLAEEEGEALELWAAREAETMIVRLPAGPAHGERAAHFRLIEAPALRVSAARALPHALCRRVLRRYLRALGRVQDVSFERTEALCALLSGTTGQCVELPGLIVMNDRGWLRPAAPTARTEPMASPRIENEKEREEETDHDEG